MLMKYRNSPDSDRNSGRANRVTWVSCRGFAVEVQM